MRTSKEVEMVIWRILWTSLWITASAHSPVLTMISKEQCFGSRVDLLCTHPDPLDDPDMYLPQVLTWAENGTTIDFTDPASARFTPTRVNSTTSMLSFNVTEEDHRDRVIPCSCFLVRNNANRDRDESEAFVLDPPEKASAPVVQSVPTNTSNVLRWTPGPGCYRHCNFTFSLTWTSTDTSVSDSGMTTATQYDFSNLPRGEYFVNIKGQCNEKLSIESNVTSVLINLTAPLSSPGPTPTPPKDPPVDSAVHIIIVVVVVLVLIVIAILTIVGFVCVCIRSKKKPITSPSHQPDKMSPESSKGNHYGRVIYADLEHSEYRPAAAPSQDPVEYTQAVQVGRRPPPPVPSPYKGSSEDFDDFSNYLQ